jgi:histidyl-tRNA synthetase
MSSSAAGPSDDSGFRPKARRPRGFMDRRGGAVAHERAIVEEVLAVYEAWGFERLETSAFEYADALGKFLPDQDRPNEGVFALLDDDEQWMALRYDLTAPLARFVAENYDALPKPYRRCAAGPVWRNEKPGPGRFREFWQCDADTVGSASPAADAEMIAMAGEALEAAGVPAGQFIVKYSSRRVLDGVLAAAGVAKEAAKMRLVVLRAIDKLDRLGREGVRALLGEGRKDESGDFTPGAGLTAAQTDLVLSFFEASDVLGAMRAREDAFAATGALAELDEIGATLRRLGAQAHARLDPSIVRGLEYYTGAVFEAELLMQTTDETGKPVRFGSVGGGGRYDDLVSRFKGQPIPATGFSIGVSRLVAALAASGREEAFAGPVVVLPFDAEAMAECFEIAREVRARLGHPAEVYLGGSGPKAQLKYADKRGAPAAIIIGSDERTSGQATVKDLRLGARLAASAGEDREAYAALREKVQTTVPRADLAPTIARILGDDQ